VNVTLEHLAPCKKLLRIDVEATVVDAAFESVIKEFVKHARLPGFRPGKAPRHLVLKAFEDRIRSDVRRKPLSEHLRKALDEQKLHIIGQPDIEEIQFTKGTNFQFAATVETAPEFELPAYKGLPLKREVRAVTEEDLERALSMLREQRATYIDLSRPLQLGDFAVVDYRGTCEGKPITELAPTARGLAEKQGFWLQLDATSFIPGFAEQLVGTQTGDKRTVSLTFPTDFVTPELAGKPGEFEVEIKGAKEKLLPELDDTLAQAYGAENVETLRSGVRADLENELQLKIKRSTREQLARELLQRVQCDLPESMVASETKNTVYEIVRENTQRGVSREIIDRQKDQIFSFASNSARDRVKEAFILGRIAEKENIVADPQEVTRRVLLIAQQNDIKPEKLVKQLQERGAIEQIQEQIIAGKVYEFLEQNAQIEEVLPGANPA